MSDINNEKINLSALIEKANATIEESQETEQPVANAVNDDVEYKESEYNEDHLDEDDDVGMGLIIEKPKEDPNPSNPLDFSKLSAETMEHVNDTVDEIDKTLQMYEEDMGDEVAEYIRKQQQLQDDDETDTDNDTENEEDDLVDKDEDEGTFREKYDEAIVVIDKTGMGSVVNFTDEEREKLEKVKKIKLE